MLLILFAIPCSTLNRNLSGPFCARNSDRSQNNPLIPENNLDLLICLKDLTAHLITVGTLSIIVSRSAHLAKEATPWTRPKLFNSSTPQLTLQVTLRGMASVAP